MDDGLVDQIYECAVSSDLWPETLDRLSLIVAGRGGVLFTARDRVLRWTASSSLEGTFKRYFEEGWLTRCTRKSCLLSRASPGFITEQDIWTAEEVDENPTYRDFLRPLGLGWSAGTALRLPTGDDLVFSFERDFDKGPVEGASVESLNALLPHLSRSAFIAARLRLARARSSAEALESLDLPAVVLGPDGLIEVANALGSNLPDGIGLKEGTRIRLADRRAQALFDEALSSAETTSGHAALSIAVRDREGVPKSIAHVIPLRRSAADVFDGGSALVVFAPVSHPKIVSIDLLRSLFDLSPAEARVARLVADAVVPKQIARDLGISVETVRFHLKQIFRKTGCRRQSDLVKLIMGATLSEPRH